MKYLKLYESHPYNWKNITEKNNKLFINIYQLASEMEDSLNFKKILTLNETQIGRLREKEQEYIKLVKKLLVDKIITFNSSYEANLTGICKDVEFHSGFGDASPNGFQFEYINIILEDEEEEFDIGDEDVIVHLDIDPNVYRDSKKYNL